MSEEAPIIVKNFNRPPKPISELVATRDFPRSALGEFVDIGGFTGVVVEVVKLSLKVTSEEGDTVSYNANGLRKLYAPKIGATPTEDVVQTTSAPVEAARENIQAAPPEPKTEPIAPEEEKVEVPVVSAIPKPNFDRPAKPIIEFASRSDFPKCTLGEFLNIGGYSGVVVEIVKQSLKVQSIEGRTMSFNANGLRKLYGTEVTTSYHHAEEVMPIRSISLEEPAKTIEAAPEPTPITQLDFNQPLKAIRAYAGLRDFPECALGKFVDVRGFSGIVVQIVGDSLDLQAEDGTVRSYDIEGLRKIFGRG